MQLNKAQLLDSLCGLAPLYLAELCWAVVQDVDTCGRPPPANLTSNGQPQSLVAGTLLFLVLWSGTVYQLKCVCLSKWIQLYLAPQSLHSHSSASRQCQHLELEVKTCWECELKHRLWFKQWLLIEHWRLCVMMRAAKHCWLLIHWKQLAQQLILHVTIPLSCLCGLVSAVFLSTVLSIALTTDMNMTNVYIQTNCLPCTFGPSKRRL